MVRHIIDVHAHLGVSETLQVGVNVDGLLRLMDANAIEMAILSPIPGYADPDGIRDTMAQNDAIAAAVRRHPDRFPTGFGTVEPRHGACALDEVKRIREELELRGLAFHCDYQGVPIDHPIMYQILERAAAYPGTVVLMHTAQHSVLEPPFMLAKVAEAFPDIVFINGHPAMNGTHLASSLYVSQKCSNVYLDLAVWYTTRDPVRLAVTTLGPDRILFGSDLPYYRYSFDKLLVEYAEIPAEVKEAIFWKNAARLFGIGRS
ncbi:amidohydrolase family protein [Geochorda subterranea]|uniref:Amidohydrolase family protein n=1 Tax=Geochorda subterranea TaxID=3109564 RepID=A0ABZ1BM81_9FIRM|nr:amidohydrolase family protein [Limnochorda sp. LNt]WRP13656.1 amidohydrolase family protein [Limnochorda sp. LNt]